MHLKPLARGTLGTPCTTLPLCASKLQWWLSTVLLQQFWNVTYTLFYDLHFKMNVLTLHLGNTGFADRAVAGKCCNTLCRKWFENCWLTRRQFFLSRTPKRSWPLPTYVSVPSRTNITIGTPVSFLDPRINDFYKR